MQRADKLHEDFQLRWADFSNTPLAPTPTRIVQGLIVIAIGIGIKVKKYRVNEEQKTILQMFVFLTLW